ncbi:MAG: histidine kinase [Ferruginibacter sp.]
MYIDSLVFSNQQKFRILRHVFFWLGWISYFTTEATLRRSQSYGLHTAFFSSISEVLCSTPIDMSFCYSIIYFLFPRFLFRGMYVKMVLMWLLFAIAGFFVYQAYNTYVTPHIYKFYGLKMSRPSTMLWAFFYFFLTFNMEGCMAAAIKLGKMWYIKKRENDVLTYQKEKMEAFIHNDDETQSTFLFHTFSRIQDLAKRTSPEIAGMISRLQKITLFTLSQYQHTQVEVEKEIQVLQEFIDLEKDGSKEPANYQLQVSGDIEGKKIASFILLPLVENIFSQLVIKNEPAYVHVNINISKDLLKCDIHNSKPPETSTLMNGKRDNIYQIKKRLNILYPGSHQLSVVIETQSVKTHLEIDLGAIVLS